MKRGDIWWADLPEPSGSEPGYRRPVVVVQDDAFNKSRIDTVVVVAVSSNLRLGKLPGNVKLTGRKTGLTRDSIVNVTQLTTIDKRALTEKIGALDRTLAQQVDDGIRLVLALH